MGASDDQSVERSGGMLKLAAFWLSIGPDFNGALFFPGNFLTYKRSLCVYRDDGVVVIFSLKKT